MNFRIMNFHTWDPVALERLSSFEGYSVLDCPSLRGVCPLSECPLLEVSALIIFNLVPTMLYGGPLTYTEGYNYEKELTAYKLMNEVLLLVLLAPLCTYYT